MSWKDINTLTYLGFTLIVDEHEYQITKELDSDIQAVQFHKGNDFVLEELKDGTTKEVELTKYDFLFTELALAKKKLTPPSENHRWDIDNDEWVLDIRLENENNLKKLQFIFYQKTVDLKAIACDKYGSNEYVEAQYQTYENMYLSAKQGLYSEEKNQEIITLNETAKNASAPITMELNEIRSALQKKIEASVDVNELLKEFEELNITFDVQPLKDFLEKVRLM